MAKVILPAPIRRFVRSAHRRFVFRRAMKLFLKSPIACAYEGNGVLLDLVYGWGNESWSARDEYLAACIVRAESVAGPILECGSGLSTILIAATASSRGQPHWVLENSPEWAAKVQEHLTRYCLTSVVLCTAPLRDYGEFMWYDPPLDSMPEHFALVICDGPPGDTRGGRYGLVPTMRSRLKAGCVILLDDMERESESAIAGRWKLELGARATLRGSTKPFVELEIREQQRSA